jgi:2-keto-4-pentenoate hydratase/2-oxohepta-3-ene-1,7-dioic acid hydratase in catechol pathway
MRFVTFLPLNGPDAAPRAGVLLKGGASSDEAVIDLAHPAMKPALGGVAPDLSAMLTAGLDGIRQRIEHGFVEAARRPLSSVRLLAPLPSPGRIYGLAHNYRDAVAERGMEPPAEPVLFMKLASSVVGPEEPIVLPAGIGGVTYEAELAAVIGRRADRVSRGHALAHVAGYVAFNDVSASEMIKREGTFERGKNLPSFGPMGPFLATADEIGDPQKVGIRLDVDGTVLQDGSTATMLFDLASLVAFLSASSPLEPGDVIATGTPAGVAPVRTPQTWLQPGQTVTIRVEGLGILSNPVVEGPPLKD